MENTAFNGSYEGIYYPKYVCIVIQFITKINAEKVMKFMRNLQNEKCENKLGKRSFHYRLVDEKVNFFKRT